MVKRLAEVTHFRQDSGGNLVETTTVENIAYPPADTASEYRAAIRQALNILGPNEGHSSGCVGCDVERRMAVRLMLDALNYETWDGFLVGNSD